MNITPKRIFQTWKTRSSVPSYLLKYQKEWKDYCIKYNYEYILYSDEELKAKLKKYFPQFLNLYNNFTHHIERVDFARYVILGGEGGIYADLDTIPLGKSLDIFVEKNVPVLGLEPEEHVEALYKGHKMVICNAFMISPPGNKLWLEFMNFISRNYKPGGNPVYNTGPMAFTLFYERNKGLFKDVIITDPCVFFPITDTEYSQKKQGGFDHVSRKCNIEKDSYVAHLWVHEWSSGFDQQFLDLDNWLMFLLVVWLLLLIFPPYWM